MGNQWILSKTWWPFFVCVWYVMDPCSLKPHWFFSKFIEPLKTFDTIEGHKSFISINVLFSLLYKGFSFVWFGYICLLHKQVRLLSCFFTLVGIYTNDLSLTPVIPSSQKAQKTFRFVASLCISQMPYYLYKSSSRINMTFSVEFVVNIHEYSKH